MKLAKLRKPGRDLLKDYAKAWVLAREEYALSMKWFDGRMIRLERELNQAPIEKAWRVSDAIDRAANRLQEAYRTELHAELNMRHAETEWYKLSYALEAERNAMLRRRLRKRRMVNLHR